LHQHELPARPSKRSWRRLTCIDGTKRWEFTFNLMDKGKDALNGGVDLHDGFLAQIRAYGCHLAPQGGSRCSTGR